MPSWGYKIYFQAGSFVWLTTCFDRRSNHPFYGPHHGAVVGVFSILYAGFPYTKWSSRENKVETICVYILALETMYPYICSIWLIMWVSPVWHGNGLHEEHRFQEAWVNDVVLEDATVYWDGLVPSFLFPEQIVFWSCNWKWVYKFYYSDSKLISSYMIM